MSSASLPGWHGPGSSFRSAVLGCCGWEWHWPLGSWPSAVFALFLQMFKGPDKDIEFIYTAPSSAVCGVSLDMGGKKEYLIAGGCGQRLSPGPCWGHIASLQPRLGSWPHCDTGNEDGDLASPGNPSTGLWVLATLLAGSCCGHGWEGALCAHSHVVMVSGFSGLPGVKVRAGLGASWEAVQISL